MKTCPLVSVGLPTYNRAATLTRAIESVLAQDYPNFELIISDNASTDGTQTICEDFCLRDDRVRYVQQARNIGLTANFQAVLDAARGEFFMWLADDDWLDPDYVRECLVVLAKEPDCQLVSGRARYYENDNFCFEEDSINLIQGDGYERVRAYFRQVNTNGVFYGLARRQVLAGLKVHNKIGADWLLIANLAFLGKIRTVESVHVNRSMGGASQQDASTVVSTYGLPVLFAKSPFLIVAMTVFTDVAWKSPVYRYLSGPTRISLATKSAISIISRFKAIKWLDKLIELGKRVSKLICGSVTQLQARLILRTRLKRGIRKVRAKLSQAK